MKKPKLRDRSGIGDPLDDRPDHTLVGIIEIPVSTDSPWRLISKRIMLAFSAIVLAVLVVYIDRNSYVDSLGDGVSLLDCVYYATVSLSTTGYGDITPVTPLARLVNVLVITPLRVIFLVVLVGTTLSVLTEQSRQALRIQRWRSTLRNHTVVIGYGTKGRSAVSAMIADEVSTSDIVVVDTDKAALEVAAARGLVTVHGSATKSDVLKLAAVPRARAVIVATNLDDTAVLVTLSARELAPNAKIVATIRESENTHLIKQSGADSVVVSAETAGRMLGLATVTPAVVGMMEDLLTPDEGFAIAERDVTPDEVGGSPRHLSDIVLAVVRHGVLIKINEADADIIENGDRLLYIRMVVPR